VGQAFDGTSAQGLTQLESPSFVKSPGGFSFFSHPPRGECVAGNFTEPSLDQMSTELLVGIKWKRTRR
jgi:hypothetical protein